MHSCMYKTPKGKKSKPFQEFKLIKQTKRPGNIKKKEAITLKKSCGWLPEK